MKAVRRMLMGLTVITAGQAQEADLALTDAAPHTPL
jgi:hypothetical protein